jgi:hypothetical protein
VFGLRGKGHLKGKRSSEEKIVAALKDSATGGETKELCHWAGSTFLAVLMVPASL